MKKSEDIDPELVKLIQELGPPITKKNESLTPRDEKEREDDFCYISYFVSKDTLEKEITSIEIPIYTKYNSQDSKLNKLCEKVRIILLKMDLIRDSNLTLQQILNQYQVKYKEDVSCYILISELNHLIKDQNLSGIYQMIYDQWEKQSIVRGLTKKRIEELLVFKSSLENEVALQLESKKYIAGALWVKNIIIENKQNIERLIEKLSLNFESEKISYSISIRLFFKNSVIMKDLIKRKMIFDEFKNQIYERQKEIPSWIITLSFQMVHITVNNFFVFDNKEDERLSKIIEDNPVKNLEEWWNSEKYEASLTKYNCQFHEETLEEFVKIFKKMLLLKNPQEKVECLIKIKNSIQNLFLYHQLELNSENLSKVIRYIIWKSKPKLLLMNIQYISLFESSESILSEFEYCTKSIQMIAEELIEESK